MMGGVEEKRQFLPSYLSCFTVFPRDCPLRILRTICCLTFGSGDSEISEVTIDGLCNLKDTVRNEVSMDMDDSKYLVNIGENALPQCSTM